MKDPGPTIGCILYPSDYVMWAGYFHDGSANIYSKKMPPILTKTHEDVLLFYWKDAFYNEFIPIQQVEMKATACLAVFCPL